MLSEAGLCFNISLDLIIALRTASDIFASNFKWWSTMTPKSRTDSIVGRMVSFILDIQQEGQALCEVTQSTLVAQLLYASSSWSGFVKAEERAKLQSNESILNKASR